MDWFGKIIVDGGGQASANVTATNVVTGAVTTGVTNANGFCEMYLPSMNRYRVVMTGGGTKTVNLGEGEVQYLVLGYNPYSWDSIKNIINAGEAASTFTSGDEFKVVLNDTNQTELTYQCEINKYGLGEVDFIPKTIYVYKQHHTSNTNAGGWNGSDIRTYLNNVFFNMLPSDLQNNISEKRVATSKGTSDNVIVFSQDKIWIPTEVEVLGATSHGASMENAYNVHYSTIFDTQAHRQRGNYWWTASPDISNGGNFCFIYPDGSSPYTNGASNGWGVLPCFRIAPDIQ